MNNSGENFSIVEISGGEHSNKEKMARIEKPSTSCHSFLTRVYR